MSPRHATPRLATPRLAVFAIAAGFAGCSSTNDTTGANASALVGVSTNVEVSTIPTPPYGGSETSASYFGGSDPAFGGVGIAAAWNSYATYSPTGIVTGVTVSTNFGTSWTTHNSSEKLADGTTYFPTFPMSSGRPVFACPPGTQSPDTGVCGWFADPWVTGTGIPQQVAVAAIVVDGITNPTHDVGVALSINNGATFFVGAALSTKKSGGGSTTSLVDGPSIASNGNGKVYAWWFSNDSGNHQHTWLRSFSTFNNTIALGTLIDLTPKLMVAAPVHATIAVQPNSSGGNDTIYLVYSDLYQPQNFSCDQPSHQMDTSDVTWWLSVSPDSGNTWNHRRVMHDPGWRHCLTNQLNGSNRTRASISYDPISARVLMGFGGITTLDAGNNCVGSRAYLMEWPNLNGQDAVDGYSSTCNPALCPPGVPYCTWQLGAPLPVGETFCNQYGVESNTIPFNGTSRAAWVWKSTIDSTSPPNPVVGQACPPPTNLQADIFGASYRPGPPLDTAFATVSRITPLENDSLGTVPWTQTSSYGNTAWGDYEGMAAGNGEFFAFWADERLHNPLFSTPFVYTANFQPN